MIMPSKDNLYNGKKGIGFENPSYFEKAKDLRPALYDEKVIGLGYTLMFLTHSDEALEIENFKRSRENKIEFAYNYGNLNAGYQTSSLKPYVSNVILEKIIIDLEDEVVNLLKNEKVNMETIESLKSKGFELNENVSSESENQSENDCLVVEKECDKEENPKVIAPGMFKLSVSQSVSLMSMSKTSCDSKNVEIKLKRKRHLDTFSSVRRPKNSDGIWKKKGRLILLMLVCLLMCDFLNDNNFFIFDDESVKISPVSKMPFRKKPCDSINVRSKSNMIKSLPRTVPKWLPKMQPLAEPVAKWFPRRVRTDNGTEFKNKTLAKFFDEIMKSSTTNVETSINEEVFHEVSESFQGESFSSSLNDDVQQSLEEVILPQTNTQSIPINMVPNGDEASTSHNVFNE
nr:hypothetical protein [Tanacetum cinerariifolium]